MKKQSFNTLLSLTAAAVLTVFAGQAHANDATELTKQVEQNKKLINDNDQRISEVHAAFGLHKNLIDDHANLITAGQQDRQELARKNDEQDKLIQQNKATLEEHSTKIKNTQDNYANLASKVGLNLGYIQNLEKLEKEGKTQRETQQNTINEIKKDLSEAKEIISENQKALQSQIRDLVENETKVNVLNGEVDKQGKTIKQHQEQLTALNQLTQNNELGIQQLQTNTNEWSKQIQENKEAISRISLGNGVDPKKVEQISKNAENIKSNRDNISRNTNKIKELNNAVDVNRAQIAANTAGIAANKADIATNKAGIAANKADIATNKAGIAANKADIATNKAGIAANKADIATNKAGIAANKADIATNKAGIAANKADIATNKAGIAANKADIATNKAGVAENKADIATNKAGIAANKTDIATNKAGIAENKSRISENVQAINRLNQSRALDQKRLDGVQAQAAQNSKKIQQLDKKVGDLDKEVRRGFATQAALGGLFQPYNVGKLNVSAAVGGYRSETAVAVGTGYRFNEHFATKAGVSFNPKGGHTAYNVGVNFEW